MWHLKSPEVDPKQGGTQRLMNLLCAAVPTAEAPQQHYAALPRDSAAARSAEETTWKHMSLAPCV